jgi:hypothetical protein
MSLKRNVAIAVVIGLAAFGYREYETLYAPWLTGSARATYIDVGVKQCREMREAGIVAADKGGDLRGSDLERFCRCTVETSADAITMAEGAAIKAAGQTPPSLVPKLEAAVQGCRTRIRS